MRILRLLPEIALIILIIGVLIFQQLRYTTYQTLLDKVIPEEETIEKITVYADLSFLRESATAEITNKELINDILNQKIKLRRNIESEYAPINEGLIISTNKENYVVGFDDRSFSFGEKTYRTIDPGVNPVYELIEDENDDLEWETGSYNVLLPSTFE